MVQHCIKTFEREKTAEDENSFFQPGLTKSDPFFNAGHTEPPQPVPEDRRGFRQRRGAVPVAIRFQHGHDLHPTGKEFRHRRQIMLKGAHVNFRPGGTNQAGAYRTFVHLRSSRLQGPGRQIS